MGFPFDFIIAASLPGIELTKLHVILLVMLFHSLIKAFFKSVSDEIVRFRIARSR